MNLGEIRAEVMARGFDEIEPTSRIDTWINRAYQRICDREAWDFLEETTTGTAPLTIADLRSVYSVIDTDNDEVLEFEDIRDVRETDPTLALTGRPACWYYTDGQVAVFPVEAVNLSVLYIKVPEDLTDDTDEPIFPERYHYTLVDFACLEGYKDSDNFDRYLALREDVEMQVLEMSNTLLVRNFDGPRSIFQVPGSSVDW